MSNLSTEAFLAAFRRFTGRRGMCHDLWSDNGTTFVGADNVLKKIFKLVQNSELTGQMGAVNWHFITPAAPHQGVLWEAAVKSMSHLRRVMGPRQFTFEALNTLLIEVEAVLNSRPLYAMSDDPGDLTVLTPAHFLIGEPIVRPLGRDVSEVPDNRLKLWAQMQKMSEVFWKSWQHDYLNTLQQRYKWADRKANLNVGDMVIIVQENISPAYWHMGRILSVSVGRDGLVRSALVRTHNGEFERPIQKLCLIPRTGVEDILQRGEC